MGIIVCSYHTICIMHIQYMHNILFFFTKAKTFLQMLKRFYRCKVYVALIWSHTLCPWPLYLDEFLLSVKLWCQHILPIGHSSEGHTEFACGSDVSVIWEVSDHSVTHDLQQVKAWVQRTKFTLSGLLGHVHQTLAALLCMIGKYFWICTIIKVTW